MAKVKLTNRLAAAASFKPPHPCYLWDTLDIGFGLRVLESGRKSWVVSFRQRGEKRIVTLGPYPAIDEPEAREAARRRIAEVHLGARYKEATFAEFAAVYMEEAKRTKRSWRNDATNLSKHLIPCLGELRLMEIRRQDLAQLHAAMHKTPRGANMALTLAHTLFNRACDLGYLPEDRPNPATRIKRYPENKRDRVLSREEAARFLSAVNEEPDESIRILIVLYLFTGARKSELLRLRWDDLDDAAGRIVLRRTKTGRNHYLTPHPAIWGLLARLHTISPSTPWLFPGNNENEPRKDIRRKWRRIRKAAGVSDLWVHDLRRTAALWMSEAGASVLEVSKALNHAQVSTTQAHYLPLTGAATQRPLAALGEIVQALLSAPLDLAGLEKTSRLPDK